MSTLIPPLSTPEYTVFKRRKVNNLYSLKNRVLRCTQGRNERTHYVLRSHFDAEVSYHGEQVEVAIPSPITRGAGRFAKCTQGAVFFEIVLHDFPRVDGENFRIFFNKKNPKILKTPQGS